MKKSCFFRSDSRRLLTDRRAYLAVIGVTVALFFALENGGIQDSVFQSFAITRARSGELLCYVFCAVPFAAVFCEDLENRYFYYAIGRGNITRYILSKAVHIYLSSVVVMVVGAMFFCLILRCIVPWSAPSDISWFEGLQSGCYGFLLTGSHYLLYCMAYAFHLGMMAGMLSLAAACLSLFVPSRIITLTAPVLFLQILRQIAGMSMFTVYSFELYNKYFKSDLLCLLFAAALSLVPSALITVAMRWQLSRRL